MRHPERVWTHPANERLCLRKLADEYLHWLKGRPKPAAPATIRKYRQALDSFLASLAERGEPAELGSLTLHSVGRWVGARRARGFNEEGIASHLAVLKAFSRGFVWLYEELTTADLLLKLPRIPLEATAKAGLSPDEIDAIFAALDTGTVEDARDAALLAVFLSTGLRFKAVLEMGDDLDRVSGEFAVVEKGGKHRPVRMSPRALKLTKRYLALRPRTDSGRLWLTDSGEPLSYWGGQSLFRRLKRRTGVGRLHAHLCRHTFGQVAIAKGAERAAVQDMLGHETDAMTRRYTREARKQTAAAMMPRFAPV